MQPKSGGRGRYLPWRWGPILGGVLLSTVAAWPSSATVLAVGAVGPPAPPTWTAPNWMVTGFVAALQAERGQDFLTDVNDLALRTGLWAAVRSSASAFVPLIAARLDNSDSDVRAAAVQALAALQAKDQAEAIAARLDDTWTRW